MMVLKKKKPSAVVVVVPKSLWCALLWLTIASAFTTTTSFFLSTALRTASLPLRHRTVVARAAASSPFSRFGRTTMTASTTSTTDGATTEIRTDPPVAPRENDRVVYAGVAPPGWNLEKVPRQSEGSSNKLLDPPVAIPDPYGWLRDEKRTNETVLAHLKAENAYTRGQTAHLEDLRGKLYDELVAGLQETDYTTPRPHGPFVYYTRTVAGQSYRLHCRAAPPTAPLQWDGSADTPILPGEQVILNINDLAKNQSYCAVGRVKPSPTHRYLAYSINRTGGETCQLYVLDLEQQQTVVDHDPQLEMDGSLAWGAKDDTLFYLKLDDTHRPFQLYRRTLGSDKEDELLLEEPDELYWMGLYKSLDGKYLFVEMSSKETSEVWFLDLHDPTGKLQCVAPRRSKVLYEVEHRHGQWWISSNVGGLSDLALWTAPAVADSADQWALVKDAQDRVLFAGSHDRALSGILCLDQYVVCTGREGGLPRVWVVQLSKENQASVESMERLNFAEEAYDVGLGAHHEFDADTVVVGYDSLVTPTQSLEISLKDTTQRTVLKEKQVPGYVKEDYACERTTVLSRDGRTEIPVSLVYRKDVMEQHLQDGKPVHTHLYGYGSYGACMEADFDSTRLPLLNRGVVYVIAHIRGGGEMGRPWYEEPNGAKYLCKKNTFWDFVDVGQWLVNDRKLTAPEILSTEGRSAGGMLIGSSINLAPELFKAAILGVPFVDVVCTMVDASIPLTAVEWEEWGNPNEIKYHQYMMEYCPMQNVQEGKKYPACLLTGGLHDPRVQFWEPTKFAATLRHKMAPGSGPICVKMDMSAGHFSASDRYKYLRELAFDYAFLLDQVGLVDIEKK